MGTLSYAAIYAYEEEKVSGKHMVQSDTPAQVAHELLWTYTSMTEESTEEDFYSALEEFVAQELTRRFATGESIWVGREALLLVGSYQVRARLTNTEPLLATQADTTTKFLARYHPRSKGDGQQLATFLAEVIRYPNERMEKTFSSLVGLDNIKVDMVRKLNLLLHPTYLTEWITNQYAQQWPAALMQTLRDRYPLFILEGEVGSGKTALARSVGSRVALRIQTEVALFVVNAQIRGGGHVGELTQNISRAFNEAERCQEQEQIPVIILFDEADALAQSRGGNQTHHEDDAGVNTLIQRIDRLRGRPIAVIFATNLLYALDSAILRRAYATYHFDRPVPQQRAEVFRRLLIGTGIEEQTIAQLVNLTEPQELPGFDEQQHRYTYSDLAQRIIPRAIEEAVYTRKKLNAEHLINACSATLPTPEATIEY